MNSHKLLLLLITVLLPSTLSLATQGAHSRFYCGQEYGDTSTLIRNSTQELRQAYDLLDILKKRSQELASQNNPIASIQARLPKDLDAIRDRMIKQPLITVLSATPFSDPTKHASDCKTAITALETYTQTLQNSLATTTTATPTVNLTTLTKTYDLGTTPTTQPAHTSAPTSSHEETATPTTTPPTPVEVPVEQAKNIPLPQPEAPTLPAPMPLPAPATTEQTTQPEVPKAPEAPVVKPESIPTPSIPAAPVAQETSQATPAATIPDIFATQAAGN